MKKEENKKILEKKQNPIEELEKNEMKDKKIENKTEKPSKKVEKLERKVEKAKSKVEKAKKKAEIKEVKRRAKRREYDEVEEERLTLRELFTSYNLAIFICVLVIVISLVVIVLPKEETPTDSESSEITIGITESQAKTIAMRKFKDLGESNLKSDNLETTQIKRGDELFYYISSKENTVEIRVADGTITMVNSVKVNQ